MLSFNPAIARIVKYVAYDGCSKEQQTMGAGRNIWKAGGVTFMLASPMLSTSTWNCMTNVTKQESGAPLVDMEMCFGLRSCALES